jgi:hypothetical protein
MNKVYLYLAFSTLFLLLFIPYCLAANPLDVVVNEISWMGTLVSYNDEWIELYNNTDSPISLDGWTLEAKDGTPEINLVGEIPAKGFFLLERTDDETIPNISADQIYTGALGNSGEKLELYDGSGNLIDQVDSSSGWFSGDNSTKQTMERINSKASGNDASNWQTSQNPGGTPKAMNSEQLATNNNNNEQLTTNNKKDETAEVKIEENSQPSIPEGEVITYPSGIVFNEILPSPKGSDETEEWIEIFNQNDFEVDLSGWKISDTLGKTMTYIFPTGTKISPKGFLVLNRPTTKITLNNDNDGLNLIQPSGNILDKVSFEKAPIGQSYNKIENSWAWSDNLTPGSENVVPIEESGKETEVEINKEKGLAAVSELFSEENQSGKEMTKFQLVLISAFGIAILSGIAILYLKRKFKPEV